MEKSAREKERRLIQTQQIIKLEEGLEADGIQFDKKNRLNSANHKTSKGLKQAKIVTLAQHIVVAWEKGRRLKDLPDYNQQIELAKGLIENDPAQATQVLTKVQNGLRDLANKPFNVSDKKLKACSGLTTEQLADIRESRTDGD
jgi:hypothetical protein